MSSLDYFGDGEKKWEDRFQKLRDRILNPVCGVLVRVGVSANAVSFVGLLMLVGVIVYFVSDPVLASAFLILYVLFDGLDGCVARRSGKASPAGSLVDIVCDQVGMAVVCILVIHYGFASAAWAGTYLFAYTVLIAVTVIRNVLKDRPQFIIRTKYVLFLAYISWAFNIAEWYTWFFWVATPLAVLYTLIGLHALWRRLHVY